jgi:hypothetical protein
MPTYFFLASYAFRIKGLVIAIVKKIPDPGGKKAHDPGSESATLSATTFFRKIFSSRTAYISTFPVGKCQEIDVRF